ncbi:MAG: hypothetical protein QXQ94_06985 [Candidatus Bathyarchaeia archaeon]
MSHAPPEKVDKEKRSPIYAEGLWLDKLGGWHKNCEGCPEKESGDEDIIVF